MARGAVIAFAALLCGAPAWAQGGPPFITDDPETPGNHNWEINVGGVGERSARDGSYSTPNFDFNYGLGDRIQLKFEIPWEIEETRGPGGRIHSDIGQSLLGVKWRFFEHDKGTFIFTISTYPQLQLKNPTRFFLPLEANATIGPVRLVGEIGRSFVSNNIPGWWSSGFMAGHEFKSGEMYLEFHNEGGEKTLGLGGRKPLNRAKNILFMAMGGHGVGSGPEWVAYAGLQFLLTFGAH